MSEIINLKTKLISGEEEVIYKGPAFWIRDDDNLKIKYQENNINVDINASIDILVINRYSSEYKLNILLKKNESYIEVNSSSLTTKLEVILNRYEIKEDYVLCEYCIISNEDTSDSHRFIWKLVN